MEQDGRGHHILILAAGASSRFGGAKLVAPFKGKPLAGWAIDAALAARAERVTVVTGAHADRLRDTGLLERGERLQTVHCENWADGLSASLRRGLSALPDDARAVLVMLGDMPQVTPALIDALFAAVDAGAPAAVPLFDGKWGNPVAFSAAVLPALRTLSGDSGARKLLRGMPGVAEVAWKEPGVLFDVDRPADIDAAPLNIRRS